jgi:hypothetical protein
LQKEIENQILLKNRKEELETKMQEIEKHEKVYIQRIKDRLKMKSQNNLDHAKDISKSIDRFNINKKDPK